MSEENSQTSPPPFDQSAHRQQEAQETLLNEFHLLIQDTERLLQETQGTTSAQTNELRQRLNSHLERTKGLLEPQRQRLQTQCQLLIQDTEQHIRKRPWQALGAAAGLGFLVGLLSRRR